jgi:hypothetical protein
LRVLLEKSALQFDDDLQDEYTNGTDTDAQVFYCAAAKFKESDIRKSRGRCTNDTRGEEAGV